MSLKHCFDFYTIRIRKKRSSGTVLLENFDNNGTDFFAIVAECMNSIDEFRDDESKKILAIRDQTATDSKQFSIHGTLKSGAYGTASEVVNRKNQKTVTKLTEDDANVFSFFFYFFLPRKSTTGALIVHRIGNHGMFSQLKNILQLSFRQVTNEHILEIDPVFFNLTNSKNCELKKIEIVLSEKKSHLQKAVSGSVSPNVRTVGRFILETGRGPKILSQMLQAKDIGDFTLDQIYPFIQIKALEKYEVSYSAKVEIGGLNKTIQISKDFAYNTSQDITEELKFENGLPTLESLLQQAQQAIQMLRENKKL